MTIRSRRAISVLLALGGVVLGAAVAWYARFVHPYRLRTGHEVFELPRNHAELDGLTIAFVTDTHIGPHFAATDLEPVIAHLRELQPDVLLLGGDYICESPRFMADAAVAIAEMVKTARFGAWGVLGNHDLANIRERIVEPLREIGVRVLENEAARVVTDRGELWIAGIADAMLAKPDLARTFANIPADAAAILLWHEPDLAPLAARYTPMLQLSGHTHGGQVRLPRLGAIALPRLGRNYVGGRYLVGAMPLYVSNGIGMYRPPVRLNCPPELTVIHLVA